jgi:hypothetical protein
MNRYVHECGSNYNNLIREYQSKIRRYDGDKTLSSIAGIYGRAQPDSRMYLNKYLKYKQKYYELKNMLNK